MNHIIAIHKMSWRRGLMLLTSALLFANIGIAQNTTPTINIGGDVYGGGKNGAVGRGNVVLNEGEPQPNASDDMVSLNTANVQKVTNVQINDGKVRTVFGGGEMARVYGETYVEVNGGEIGGEEWDGTVHGGVFGGGDGSTATVFGSDEVLINGGIIWNNVYGGGQHSAEELMKIVKPIELNEAYTVVF